MHKLYGYWVWLVVTLFVVYSFCLNTASSVFADAIRLSLNVSSLGVVVALGAFVLGFALFQIPVGFLLDKYNPRYIVSCGIFLLALGNISVAYANHLMVFLAANFVQGVGASFAFISAAVLIAQWFPQKKFPILFGLTQAISCILTGIIHYGFSLALATHSWNEIYQQLSLYGLVLGIVALFSIKSPHDFQRPPANSLERSLKQVLTNKHIMLCTLAAATSFGVLLVYAGLWYIKIQAYYGVQENQAVIIGGMIFAGIGLGTPILAAVSNYVKSRTMVIHVSLCLGTMALLLGIYLPHFATKTLIIIQIISFIIGFFLAGSMLFYTMVNEFADNASRGVAISVLNTVVFLFNTMMMFIPYLFLTAYSQDFFTYLWTLPFFLLFSILILYFIKESTPSNE